MLDLARFYSASGAGSWYRPDDPSGGMVRAVTFRFGLIVLCCLGACGYPDYLFVPTMSSGGSCSDRLQNDDESDIDCGGSACGQCVTGQSCLVPRDCDSGVCQTDTD